MEVAYYLEENGIGGVVYTSRPKQRIEGARFVDNRKGMGTAKTREKPLLPITSTQHRLLPICCKMNHVWIPLISTPPISHGHRSWGRERLTN
jgi:hypothetical protein